MLIIWKELIIVSPSPAALWLMYNFLENPFQLSNVMRIASGKKMVWTQHLWILVNKHVQGHLIFVMLIS